MKKSLLLMLFLALTWAWTGVNAQEQLTVYDGTTTNGYVPAYMGYFDDFTRTQTVIPASDLEDMAGGTISAIKFYTNSDNVPYTTVSTVDVYLKEVSTSSISAFEDKASCTMVYQGTLDIVAEGTGGALSITFNTPFQYQGENLLIGIENTTDDGYTFIYFYGQTVNGASVGGYNSSSLAKVTPSQRNFIPKTTFTYTPGETPSCIKPNGLAANDITANSAELSWTEKGTATSWQLCIDGDEVNLITVTPNPSYSLTGLNPLSSHTVKVRSYCSASDQSDWTSEISFTTLAVAEPVGDSWSDDFEGASCGWELINGTQTNMWAWGTAANNGGTHSLYISSDNGTTYAYSGGASFVYATKLLSFTDGKFAFSYDWQANGEGYYDYLRVWLAPSSATFTSGQLPDGTSSPYYYVNITPAGWIALDGGSKLNLATSWESKEVATNVTAGNYYLVLMWCNDGSGGSQPPAAVDNVSIVKLACPYDVEGLEVTDGSITTSEASLTWTAGDATQWQVAYSLDNSFPVASTTLGIVSEPSMDLSALSAASVYYVKVRAYCGETDFGAWSDVISFTTECAALDISTGWSENFDSYTASGLPICWSRVNGGTSYNSYPYIYGYSSYSHSASNCLYFYTYGSSSSTGIDDQYAILPEMDGLNGKQITLWAKGYSASSSFKIGLMSDPADVSTFTEIVNSANPAISTSYQEYTFIIPSTTDNYVAIMMPKPKSSSSSSYGVYIDDISILDAPTCDKPTALNAVANGLNATFSWTSDAGNFSVAHATDATANPDDNIVAASVSDESYEMNSLALGDHYFWVRANCGGSNGSSVWAGPISVHIGYCVPGPTSRDGKGITGVAFGQGVDVVNNSDANGLPNASPYYGDYKDQIGAVQAGVESTIAITTSTGSYPYTFVIWVDFDNDLTFEDEEIIYTGKCASGAGILNANITIPASQALGDYRMRIAGADSYFNSFYNNGGALDYTKDHDPCLTGSKYAVFHDYTLRVLAAPSCLKPTNLAVSDITSSGASFSWTAGGSEGKWQYAVADAGEDPVWDDQNLVSAKSKDLTGLTANTSYDFYVRAYCSATEQSDEVMLNFRTECEAISTLPWNEDFEGMDADIVPLCWDNSESTAQEISSNPERIWGVYSYGGNKMIRMYNYLVHSGTALINSPSIVIPSTPEYELVFDYAHNASCGDFKVKVSEDGGTTFVDLGTYTKGSGGSYDDPGSFTEISISLADYAGKTIVLQFFTNANYGSGAIFVDNVRVREIPSCSKPTGLTLSDVAANSATLSWAAGNNQWQYAVVETGHDLEWNGNVVADTFVTVQNLKANTSYNFYVRAYCSATDQSDSIMLNFRTECEVAILPFVESFDSLKVANSIPDCWDNSEGTTTSASSKWSFNTSTSGNGATKGTGVDGGNCIRFDSYTNSESNTNFLATPIINLSEAAVLTFWWKNPTGGAGEVLISVDGEDKVSLLSEGLTSISSWTFKNIDLSTYTGHNVQIFFKGTSNWEYDDAYLYLDNVCVAPIETIAIDESLYATYYNEEKGYIMPENLTGHVFSTENTPEMLVQEYEAGDIVPAATPLVLEATAAGNYSLVPTIGGVDPDASNQLVGVNEATDAIENEAGNKYYVLSLNAGNDVDSIGFYWMNTTGAGGFAMPAHKAYLKVPDSQTLAPAQFYLFNGENNATWLENLQGVEGTVKFMHEGNIYILRDSIIYDATGRKVRELK